MGPPAQKQALVQDHFSSQSPWWDAVHRNSTLTGKVIQQRSLLALEWIEDQTGSRIENTDWVRRGMDLGGLG